MTSDQTTSAPSGQALLPSWANGQDSWCRGIAADVLRNRVQAADADIDRHLKILLAEKKLSDESFEPVAKIEEKQATVNTLDVVRIESLMVGDGVNALKAGSQVEFANGVTVVFGENGSGKSGFVRVLKRAAGVRTAEDILHNVRTEKKVAPAATFSVAVGDSSQQVEWNNEFGVAPLNRLSVFDTRGARLHLEEDLTYVYTPGELTLFPMVQNGIERVRTALETAIGKRTPGTNTLLTSFERSSSIYSNIETLGAATDLDEIRQYAAVPQDVDSQIESLKTEVDALRSTNVQSELKRTQDRATLVLALQAALDAVAAFDPAAFEARVLARDEASRRREEAVTKAFDGLPIPGLLGPEWRQFIQSGEEYLKKHAPTGYPEADQACAYCQQPLTAAALELVKKYRDFTNNEITTAYQRADGQLRAYAQALVGLNLDVLQQQLTREVSSGGDVLEPLAAVLARAVQLAADVAARRVAAWPEKVDVVASASAVTAAEAIRLAELATSLQKSVTDRQSALKDKQTLLTELQAKRTAQRLLPQIEKRVSDAKWIARANIVKSNLTGVLRSLTEAAKQAGEELLNKDFGKRFEQECKLLRAPNVTLNFPGVKGQVTRRKMVASYNPRDVLSEGEQKALALADFLAEVTAVPASSPVVFDDPITSMDYRRIHEVCDRVVALANDHQVIVFTHNIWFAAELLAKADKKSWKYYDIRIEGSDAGIVTSATHPRVDTIAQVSARVKKMSDAADKATDGEVRAALVEKGYEELRGLCEVVVEQEMLKGVVQRYLPNVMMTKLEKINVDGLPGSMQAIMPVFDKCCRYIASHSQPIETQGIRPTLDELKADYDAVLKARDPHKEK